METVPANEALVAVDAYLESFTMSKGLNRWLIVDSNRLFISNQIVSVEDLSDIVTNVKEFIFDNVKVINEEYEAISFEKLVETFPNVHSFICDVKSGRLTFSKWTIGQLVKLSTEHFISNVMLRDVPDSFDVYGFNRFMMKNNNIKIKILFAATDNEAFKKRIEQLVDQILVDKSKYYKSPFLWFPGLSESKSELLEYIYNHK